MDNISSNNKRIAKNTIALYFRTFITMIVGLYTGRVMLQALGVDNYGINNVVGSIIGMSSLIVSTMSEAISRYITYTLGLKDKGRLKTMFSTSVNAQIIMSIIAIIILEVLGLWFLNTQASIPENRLAASKWVFQFSLATLSISLISSPYNALIIAHEKMGLYAYTGIVETSFRLVICFVIMAYDGDRLILLAALNLVLSLGMRIFYGWYCSKHYEEAVYSPYVFDKKLLKELTTFSGWNFLNNSAWVFSTQGINMLVNTFFGVAYNAARGVAQTVNSTVQSFVGNFTMAFSPQITKNYASGEVDYAIRLANRGTKFAWLMMYVFIVPVCCEADMLLKLWLGTPPEWSSVFLRFTMFESLSVTSGQNLYRLIQADGNVKRYTIHAALIAGLIFPIAWLSFRLGAPVWTAYLIFIIDFFILNLVRFYNLKRLMRFSVLQHFRETIFPCLIVSFTSFIIPLYICFNMSPSITRFLVNVPVSIIWTCICCVLFGLTKNERQFIMSKAHNEIAKIRK